MSSRLKVILSAHYKLFLSILIFFQALSLIFTFANKREGVHSDENWSYGYANSFYQQHIYADASGNNINLNEWKDSSILRDYIQVNKDQRFRFDSVFSNMSEDYSPPLHSLILHAICSFFPDTFSWWYGFFINIIAFILSIWILFMIVNILFKSIPLSFAISFFYGFSFSTINCFIFIRTYGLLTCFALSFIYLLIKLVQAEKIIAKFFVLVYMVTVLGCLSHYFYYAFAFFLSFAFCINLLIQKKIKLFFTFAFTMLLSVVTSLIIFPSTIHMVLKGQSLYAMHMPLSWEIKYCINLCFLENFGFVPPYPTSITWCIVKFACIFLFILLSGFLFLFRKEPWLIAILRKLKLKTKTCCQLLPATIKNLLCSFWFSLLFTFCFTFILIAKISNVFLMNIFTDRYLFFLMPIFDLCIIKFVYIVLQYITKRSRHFTVLSHTLITLLLCMGLIANHLNTDDHYYFKRNTNAPTLTSLTRNANVIITLSSDWHFTCYTTLLRESKSIFVCIPNSKQGLDYMKPALEKLDNHLPVYLIMEKSSLDGVKQNSGSFDIINFNHETSKLFTSGYTEKNLTDFFSSSTWCTTNKKIQTEKSFQGELVVYQLR